MINQDVVRQNWHSIKSDVQSAWDKISGDDLEKAKGDFSSLIGVIEQKYGSKKEVVTEKLENIVERFRQASPAPSGEPTPQTERTDTDLSQGAEFI